MSSFATGGTEVGPVDIGGTDYYVHTFTTGGSFEVLGSSLAVEYLVVAGGGGGGRGDSASAGGGGGGGGVRAGSTTLAVAVHAITVGGGGAGAANINARGTAGGASSIGATVVTVGGGGGGSENVSSGGTGGSGGGGMRAGTGGAGTSGEGYAGGNGYNSGTSSLRSGGGGGGQSEVGAAGASAVGGDGGEGLSSSINGTATVYGSGGGGASRSGTRGTGGTNAGTGGLNGSTNTGTNGTANRGGGGGGSTGNGSIEFAPGDGSTGIVIIRYLAAASAPDPDTGYTRITIADDFANLSASTQEWAPAGIQAGDFFDYDVTAGTLSSVTDWLEFGVSVEPLTISYYWWDASTSTYSAEGTQTFSVPTFTGIIRDTFTGADGTSIVSHSPNTDTEGGGWSLAKGNHVVAAPTTATIESNRFAPGESIRGADIDSGLLNLRLEVDWIIGAQTTAASTIHIRRADESNYVAMYVDQALGVVRIPRRESGAYAQLAEGFFSFQPNTTYRLKIVAIQNTITCYVNGSQIVTTEYAANQGATNTRIGLFSASGYQPSVFDNLEVYSETPPTVIQVSVDQSTYSVDTPITIGLTPSAQEALDTLTLDGVNVFSDYTATGDGEAGGVLAGPALTDFLDEVGPGAFNGTPWFTNIDLVGGFPIVADTTTTIKFTGPEEVNIPGGIHWAGVVGAESSDNFENLNEGDLYYYEITSGVISSVDAETGIPVASQAGTADFWAYLNGVWTQQSEVLFDITSVATTPPLWAMEVTNIYGANDAWMSFLFDQGFTHGSLNDRMYSWLGSEGYEGSISDRLSAWSRNNLKPYV